MKPMGCFRLTLLLLMTAVLPGCASNGAVIASPNVELTGVSLTSASFSNQTFLLDFHVGNPNSFPLPVKAVEYRLAFDDKKFASGSTRGNFTVPANGVSSFAISVELDLLRSSTHFASMVSGRSLDDLSYELEGELAIDIPLLPPVAFRNAGTVNLTQTASRAFQ